MRIYNLIKENSHRLCLELMGTFYDVSCVVDYIKGSSIPKEYFTDTTVSKNFLIHNDIVSVLEKIDDLLLKHIESPNPPSWVESSKIVENFCYAPPIPVPPLLFGLAGNCPQTWRTTGTRIPNYPVGYVRPWQSIAGHKSRVILDKSVTSFRCAAELGIVIGKTAYKVTKERAMEYILGYTIVNDMIGNQWKNFANQNNPNQNPTFHELLITSYYGRGTDGFAPIGPVIVSKSEITNPYDLLMYTSLNGNIMDRSHTNSMVVGIENTIEYLSQFMTLLPGTIIHMGTMGIDGITIPEDYFIEKNVSVDIEIEQIGKLSIFFCDKRESAQ